MRLQLLCNVTTSILLVSMITTFSYRVAEDSHHLTAAAQSVEVTMKTAGVHRQDTQQQTDSLGRCWQQFYSRLRLSLVFSFPV